MISRKAFTLIELLIVVAIITILAVMVVLVIKPVQLIAQSHDASRISDIATINSALDLYSADQARTKTYSLGTPFTVYMSIPDSSSTCGDLQLMSMPAGYTWGCSPFSTFRNVNGTGWIPVNFSAIAGGAPFGSLPIDPTNNTSSHLFYTYTTNGTQYEVTAAMESAKYQKGGGADVITGDGAALSTVYAEGTNVALEPLDYGPGSVPGLVGYWPLNEGAGTTAADLSGSGNNGTWGGTTPYYTTGRNGSYAGNFNGSNDVVDLGIPASLQLQTFTLTAWIDAVNNNATRAMFGGSGWGDGYYEFRDNSANDLELLKQGQVSIGSSASTVPAGTWVFVAVTYDSNGNYVFYINGTAVGSGTNKQTFSYGTDHEQLGKGYDGVEYFNGAMQDMRVYNRALSASEIKSLYNAGN